MCHVCVFFSGFTRHIAGATIPYMHHNALYRCMLVTVFFLTKSDRSTFLAVADGEQKICMAFVLIKKSGNYLQ